MSREAYEKLLTEDLAWLMKQPHSLERLHIEEVLRHSAEREYGQRPEERGMFVPLEVWNWLMGEGPDFEPTEKQKGALMGPGRYWWRSELCRRMEDAGSCPLSPQKEKL